MFYFLFKLNKKIIILIPIDFNLIKNLIYGFCLVHKNCIDSKTCVRSLKIIHGVHSLELLANLQVLYNNFTYSPAQVCL